MILYNDEEMLKKVVSIVWFIDKLFETDFLVIVVRSTIVWVGKGFIILCYAAQAD